MARRYTVQIDRERCKGCELCVAVCPRQVLEISDKINSRGYHYARVASSTACIGCAQCSDMCPDVAIEISEEVARHA
jgi:2-oxoglutarate ferredoxin oxidoreductase subunit delta